MRFVCSARVLVFLVVCFALGTTMPSSAVAQTDLVNIKLSPTDSVSVRFAEPVCASRLEAGQTLALEVAEDLELSGFVVVEEGASVVGVVDEVKRNGRGGKGGSLSFTVLELQAADTAQIKISGESGKFTRVGGNRGFIPKLLTFWLIKGKDPCFISTETFRVAAERVVTVRVSRQ